MKGDGRKDERKGVYKEKLEEAGMVMEKRERGREWGKKEARE